ncbi:MAG TPA: hypothetical protein ENG73_10080 [Desulfobacterales bacterium]|nr:MAG: hypothetical protein DRH50_02755 [Deltaproteobacteria bacterium]HDG98498.1 hypothetical protein [Desulfobacterales bacterium]
MKRHYTKSMSEQEANLLLFIQDEEKFVFTTSEIRKIAGSKNFKDWPTLLINLKRKGWIAQLEKGKYLVRGGEANSFLIAARLVKPAAIAYWSALNHYGLTEQIPNTVFVQTTKRKRSREVLNVRYKFITISPHKFFGLQKEWVRRNYYSITDIEKTILDCFDKPDKAGGFPEAVKGLCQASESLDKDKLWEYALLLRNNAVVKRLACISEMLDLKGFEEFQTNAREGLTLKYSLLDPLSPPGGKYLRKWRLLLNRSQDEIIGMAKDVF